MSTRFNSFTTAERVCRDARVSDLAVLVTGANSGIGLETARVLAKAGAHVTMACRSPEKAEAARDALLREGIERTRLRLCELDLTDLRSVRAASERLRNELGQLDLLINNAGVVSPKRKETAQGHELHFGVNHLGHFVLTMNLLPLLRASRKPRVVNVASDAMMLATTDAEFSDLAWKRRPYETWVSYGDSKLMNLLFTLELWSREGITTHAVHPGVVMTNLVSEPDLATTLLAIRALPQIRSVKQGAATSLYAAVHPKTADNQAGYYAFCRPHRMPQMAFDLRARERLWEISSELAGPYLM